VRALVTAELTDDGVHRLEALGYAVERAGWGATRRALDPESYRAAAAGAALLLTEIELVDDAVLEACPDLRLVGTARGGPVNVDLVACAARGVPVLFTPARNADSVADFTVGLVLSLVRGISAAERHLRTHGWHVDGELPYLHFRGPELAGRTLGVVGYGATGRRVAQRLRDGFGMSVLLHDPFVEGSVPLGHLLGAADVVTLHCPRSPQTRGMVDPWRMRPGTWLVNTAGGSAA
jgi:D-3-phosphoglycerate dehydrogenase / 2-oxoglutarate reductase